MKRIMVLCGMVAIAVWGGMASGQVGPLDRARLCRASASSYRLARLEEIPMSRNVTANVKLAMPQIRPRWMARYALDGSPLTRWASAEDAQEKPWVQVELGNPLRPRVMVSGLAITWGHTFATAYRIMASTDGDYWKPVFTRDAGAGGADRIVFPAAVPAAALRIEITGKSGSSIEIIDLEVLGDPEEAAPAPIDQLLVTASSTDSVTLRWDQADETTWVYRVYRAQGRDPNPQPDLLAETVTRRDFTDHGLLPGREYRYLVVAESFGGKTSAGRAVCARTAAGPGVPARFAFRGIIEGFYNDPWPHQERLRMMEFLEDAGFNYYIYAPKMDPYHRQLWREPYPAAELANFVELLAAARAHGITLNYGISPGLDMNLKDPAELARLQTKLRSLFELGFRTFTLCLDDIPGTETADRKTAEQQVGLVNRLLVFLRGLDPAAELLFVPTVYSHTPSWWNQHRKGGAEYLKSLRGLDPSVGIMWTGPGEVFSKSIAWAEAAELADAWGRRVLLWDNYPVNDVLLRNNVFMGPYVGRAPDLDGPVAGVLLNPMYLPAASKLALYTAGRWFQSRDYDPWRAYEQALRFLARDEQGLRALKPVADCLTTHPVFPELSIDRTPIWLASDDYFRTGRGPVEEKRLRYLLEAYAAAVDNLRLLEPGLAEDLLEPARKLSLYGQAGLRCLDLPGTEDPDRRARLRAEALAFQAQARLNPWHVADEQTGLGARFIGGRIGQRNVLDDFVTRALREVPAPDVTGLRRR